MWFDRIQSMGKEVIERAGEVSIWDVLRPADSSCDCPRYQSGGMICPSIEMILGRYVDAVINSQSLWPYKSLMGCVEFCKAGKSQFWDAASMKLEDITPEAIKSHRLVA